MMLKNKFFIATLIVVVRFSFLSPLQAMDEEFQARDTLSQKNEFPNQCEVDRAINVIKQTPQEATTQDYCTVFAHYQGKGDFGAAIQYLELMEENDRQTIRKKKISKKCNVL